MGDWNHAYLSHHTDLVMVVVAVTMVVPAGLTSRLMAYSKRVNVCTIRPAISRSGQVQCGVSLLGSTKYLSHLSFLACDGTTHREQRLRNLVVVAISNSRCCLELIIDIESELDREQTLLRHWAVWCSYHQTALPLAR